MKVGFTGTRNGMTTFQRASFLQVTYPLDPLEFHHGDCVGADEEAHSMLCYAVKVVGHPPLDSRLRAWCDCDELRTPKDYIARDHDIVDETDLLIAAPKTAGEVRRSGTWATVRYARSQAKPVTVVNPDGTTVRL